MSAVEAVIRYVVAGEKAIFYPADRERSYWPAGRAPRAIDRHAAARERSCRSSERLRAAARAERGERISTTRRKCRARLLRRNQRS